MDELSALEIFVNKTLVNPYSSFTNSLPQHYQLLLNIFIYVVLIALYAIFVFEFYRFLAKKNILRLNLSQYNTSNHPFFKKFFRTIFFLLEYIIILPVLVFFWFAVLSFILLILSKEQSVEQILLISAAVVGAIRITSYFNEDLSRDLAKMFPFTILAIFLLSPRFFEFILVIEKLTQIPIFFSHILWYLVFIIGFEILIRVFYTISFLFKRPEEQEVQEVEEAVKED
ncbi:MAG TPA: hypothetical protein VMZ91_06255 [Candidatus Paceibacterota bacterium]|nr:hypothetical protein [Candidatus Paceibacterota bacterium]